MIFAALAAFWGAGLCLIGLVYASFALASRIYHAVRRRMPSVRPFFSPTAASKARGRTFAGGGSPAASGFVGDVQTSSHVRSTAR